MYRGLGQRGKAGAYTLVLHSFLFSLATLAPLSLVAGEIKLDSREYKMMLKPSRFEGTDAQSAVDRFTREQLVPALRDHWSQDAADELFRKGLKSAETRMVTFKDSDGCELYHHGFAWRERTDIKPDGTHSQKREVTLKFRSPDAFLASGLSLDASPRAEKPKSKLEEDLSPLAVRISAEKGFLANPRSVRSQFSRSTTQDTEHSPTDLGGIASLYPSFEQELRRVSKTIAMATPLTRKSEIFERVYESSKLKIAKDAKGEFILSLWYKLRTDPYPLLTEISYKYPARDDVPFETARASLELLIKLQDSEWADPSAPTKTSYVSCDLSDR